MVVITTPTGQIGKQVLALLLHHQHQDPIRVIVRDPIRLDSGVRSQVEIVQGSHDDPAVLSRALEGAEARFWLVRRAWPAPALKSAILASPDPPLTQSVVMVFRMWSAFLAPDTTGRPAPASCRPRLRWTRKSSAQEPHTVR